MGALLPHVMAMPCSPAALCRISDSKNLPAIPLYITRHFAFALYVYLSVNTLHNSAVARPTAKLVPQNSSLRMNSYVQVRERWNQNQAQASSRRFAEAKSERKGERVAGPIDRHCHAAMSFEQGKSKSRARAAMCKAEDRPWSAHCGVQPRSRTSAIVAM